MHAAEVFGVREAVALLSRTSGETYELAGRLAGGETGAHEVVGPGGRRSVLKWDLDPASQAARRTAVGLTRRLRTEADWPVPDTWTVEGDGCLLVLQDLVAGTPVDRLTHGLLDQLLALHGRRAALARSEDASSWPLPLLTTLTTGGAGYCLHEPLRRYDRRTAHLVARIENLGASLDPAALAGEDIVHWDWHPGNVLQVDGALTAVVDNDFVTTGDAAFDVVTLAISSLAVPCDDGVRARLFAAAFDGLSPEKRQAYVGHLLVRFLDWPIRRGRPDEVEFWLGQADRLLGS